MKIEHENSSKKLCTVIDPATTAKFFLLLIHSTWTKYTTYNITKHIPRQKVSSKTTVNQGTTAILLCLRKA